MTADRDRRTEGRHEASPWRPSKWACGGPAGAGPGSHPSHLPILHLGGCLVEKTLNTIEPFKWLTLQHTLRYYTLRSLSFYSGFKFSKVNMTCKLHLNLLRKWLFGFHLNDIVDNRPPPPPKDLGKGHSDGHLVIQAEPRSGNVRVCDREWTHG